MSIRKDPRSPYYQYDFKRNGQRFHGSTGVTTRRDAERYESELKRKIALGDNARPPIKLGDACDRYWQDKGQHEANAYTTEYQLGNLCRIIGESRTVGLLRQADLADFVAKRRKEKARNKTTVISPATLNRELQLASRVWKHARSLGYDVAPADDPDAVKWEKLKLKEPKERIRELSADEEQRLLAQLNPDLLAVVEFAYLSGQRKNAIVTLEWSRVDIIGRRAGVITKGSKEHWFPLTPRLIQIIQERPRVEGCQRVFTYVCKRPSPPRKDRPRRYRGQRYPFSKEGWSRHWYKALKDAGIANFRFHDLRHTSATRVVRSSGNLKAAQKLLGHTDISTTARYAHVMDDDLREIMSDTELRNSNGKGLAGESGSARES